MCSNQNSVALKRIRRESSQAFENMDSDPDIKIIPNQEDLFNWTAVMTGPQDTVWQEGVFDLTIAFPQDYPAAPPKVHFTTKMFHPNIYADGSICLDILKENWKPLYTIDSVLRAVRSLLQNPNPDSPANHIAASLFAEDKVKYEAKVKQMIEKSWEQQ